jgi:hypothetical protein
VIDNFRILGRKKRTGVFQNIQYELKSLISVEFSLSKFALKIS